MNLKVKSKKRNKFNPAVLAGPRSLESHSSLFVLQPWKFLRHRGTLICFQLAKIYLCAYTYVYMEVF